MNGTKPPARLAPVVRSSDPEVISLAVVDGVVRAARRPRRDGGAEFAVDGGRVRNVGADRVRGADVAGARGALDFIAFGVGEDVLGRRPRDRDGAVRARCGDVVRLISRLRFRRYQPGAGLGGTGGHRAHGDRVGAGPAQIPASDRHDCRGPR